MKLSKLRGRAHEQACHLLAKPTLKYEERGYVLEHWHEGATHINSLDGAYFTPLDLASSLCIECGEGRILDLCAGIGRLAHFAQRELTRGNCELVCIDINPDYVAVGRKVVPNAKWICADIFGLPTDLGHFDFVISNPPFGATARTGKAPRYTGRNFEYHALDIASDLADHAVFLIPQQSAPFRISGRSTFSKEPEHRTPEYQQFVAQTGIELDHSCGIDTSLYDSEWTHKIPRTEVVVADLKAARQRRPLGTTGDLFAATGPQDRSRPERL